MDAPSNYGQVPTGAGPTTKGAKKLGRRTKPSQNNPQLFADMSQHPANQQQQGYAVQPPQGYYGNSQVPQQQMYNPNMASGMAASGQGQVFPGQQYLNDPVMANMAMQYGGSLAGQGKEYMQKNLEKYVSTSKLKYYFAVDTSYVGKKLGLLLFPFAHPDWSVQYNQDEPVAPRYEVNAPDLYIPAMGFVTFVLVSAIALGVQNRFTPETIGIMTSSAMGYLLLEILITLFTLYIMSVQTSLSYMDWLAYCGYKYTGMVLSLLAGIFINKTVYYCCLAYTGAALAFFLMRSLKVQILPHSDDYATHGNKRRLYVLISLACVQPVFMWWLTFALV